MSELGPSAFDKRTRHPMDVPGGSADVPMTSQELYAQASLPYEEDLIPDDTLLSGEELDELIIANANEPREDPPANPVESQDGPPPPAASFDPSVAAQYYTAGASQEDFRAIGIDPDQVASYIRSLPQDQRDYYKDRRSEAKFARKAKETLMAAHPELFQGKVPEDAEQLMHEAGFDRYAVGFVQIDAIQDLDDAKSYMGEQGGVEMAGYGPNQRFLIHDSEHPSEDYPLGYYTPKIGRFVYAFPVEGDGAAPRDAAIQETGIPSDTFIENQDGEMIASGKYCVGFIDSNQVLHRNPGFMRSEGTVNDSYENDVKAQVRAIHEAAESDGRPLNDEEVMAIKGLAKGVHERRKRLASGDNNDEITSFLHAEQTDAAAVSVRYEAEVQHFIHTLREQAANEGRDLTPEEVLQIKNAAKTVQDFRRVATGV